MNPSLLKRLPLSPQQAISYGVVSATLLLLGAYRVLFNVVALHQAKEVLLAEVIFLFSYVNIIAIVGSSGSVAVYQRLTGEALGKGDGPAARQNFLQGLLICLAGPLILDGIVKLVATPLTSSCPGFAVTPFVLAIALYNYSKPLVFTYKRQTVFSVFEIGFLLTGLLLIVALKSSHLYFNLVLLLGPQILSATLGLGLVLKQIRHDHSRDGIRLFPPQKSREIFWGSIGVASSVGLIHILSILGKSRMEALEYSLYVTAFSIIGALNLFNRSFSLILLPNFTRIKGEQGQQASVDFLNRIFRIVSLAAIPFWCLLGAVPIIAGQFLSSEIPPRIYPASLILILFSFVSLITSPLVNFNLGAGAFRMPQFGSLAGAAFGLSAAMIFLPSHGSIALSGGLLIAISINYLVNSLYLVRREFMATSRLTASFGGQLAVAGSYFLATQLLK
ncbi:MAG: hypothetical protein AAF514_04875 [Verrucomicrobiota bacterium]